MKEIKQYTRFVNQLKEEILRSQYLANRANTRIMLELYWFIGKQICIKQKELDWGKSVVENLSKDLQREFDGIYSFSPDNLWRMRQFYFEYRSHEFLPPMMAEIEWTHNTIILEKCKDDLKREFYIRMTRKYAWTKNVLIHQIEGNSYALYLSNQTNFEQTLPEKYWNQAILEALY